MLAVFTALSTMLVGLTLLSVAMLREPWPTPSIGSAADDPDTAADAAPNSVPAGSLAMQGRYLGMPR